MPALICISVFDNRELRAREEFDGPVSLGRQRDREETLFARTKLDDGGWRWCIATREEVVVGRSQLRFEPLGNDTVRVCNGSDRQPIRFLDRADLPPGASVDLLMPVLILLGPTKTLRIEPAEATPREELRSLAEKTHPPLRSGAGPLKPPPTGASISNRELIVWLNSAMDVLQAAAGSDIFFERAAKAAIEGGQLDHTQVLQRENGQWVPKATVSRDPAFDWPPRSARVLDKVLAEKRTFYEVPRMMLGTESLVGIDAAVAAPILDCDEEVIGALYGVRRRALPTHSGVTELEAMFIELLARGVAAGLARLEKEREVARAEVRARYAPYFATSVIDEVIHNGTVLRARESEVTILFCDMRGFTRISQRLGVRLMDEWCREALDALSECILAQKGVLVDFTGDGMIGMWGAPGEQRDHAARACRAALAMLAALGPLNARWQARAQEALALGVGIHTGSVHVGNIGSTRKFKYGPRGPMVNLASRIEGVTKQYPCAALISSSTEAHLAAGEFLTRRLGRVRPVSVEAAVELHQLVPHGHPHWPRARDEYERALAHFEGRQFDEAVYALGQWRDQCRDDGPALRLLERAVSCMTGAVPETHPVWELKGK